jgi:prepilin signal peptidase PulO-like enzyme (type II secretory pathway)
MIQPLLASRASLWTWAFPYGLAVAIAAAAVLAVLLKEPGLHRGLLGIAYLAVLTFIAMHDVRFRRAPNRVVYPALALAVGASLTLGWSDAREALLGGLVAFLVMFVLAIIGRGAMGFGDVKVAALCGIVVGFHGVLPMLVLALIAGGLVAAAVLLLRVRKRTDSMAFTPFLVGATALSMLYYSLYLW